MSEPRRETQFEDIDEIIALAQEHDLDSLSLVDEDFELTITRREARLPEGPAPSAPPVAAPVPPPDKIEPAGNIVVAPMIGVFYRAPAPDAPVFVNLGDRVRVGQSLCILEAMKLMNEITSEYAGVIEAIHTENAELVTIGQPLFTISRATSA
jgi:acetyl-CoA carboxylase biotin carboxyl carrier protein